MKGQKCPKCGWERPDDDAVEMEVIQAAGMAGGLEPMKNDGENNGNNVIRVLNEYLFE